MYQIDFNQPVHVHFIGIGGISMSGLAEILLSKGFPVSGSDIRRSELTDLLEKKGASIFLKQCRENLDGDIDLVVYTAAISQDNPEFAAIAERNLPSLTRAQLLGQIMKNYKTSIAISGTHGKTTTTSMLSQILLEADVDPTLSIGGMLKSINGNFRMGNSDCFVTEACEYTNSFLSFSPTIAVILNIEEDHMDFFKDIYEIRESFHKFASLLPKDGVLVINGDIKGIDSVIRELSCRIIRCSLSETGDYFPSDITYDVQGNPSFTVHTPDKDTFPVTLSVPGEHNVSNALAALAVADLLSIDRHVSASALASFAGASRRFEQKGKIGGITIIDDYAHHPTEIEATLKAARNYPHKTLWCVFQPHTYTRTKAFLSDFARVLSLADKIVLADIYAAREKNTLGISSRILQEEIEKSGKDCYYFPSFDEIENFLLENCINGDLLITMGAGDVVKIGENLLGT